MKMTELPLAARRAQARWTHPFARYFMAVDLAGQRAALFERQQGRYEHCKTYRCSTSKFGIGEVAGSNKTPRGLHRVARKVGGGWPVGAAFQHRKLTGYTWDGKPFAGITTRIMWLEGLEEGFNRGGNVDTFRRYVYIHGTGDEPSLGKPASHGCIHLVSQDLMTLYDKLPVGTLVWIG